MPGTFSFYTCEAFARAFEAFAFVYLAASVLAQKAQVTGVFSLLLLNNVPIWRRGLPLGNMNSCKLPERGRRWGK